MMRPAVQLKLKNRFNPWHGGREEYQRMLQEKGIFIDSIRADESNIPHL